MPPDRYRISKLAIQWYHLHKRDLPFRDTQDPYAIMVSEFMLQQTQVSTVLAYFERFMKTYPTVAHLARADENGVMALWSGLGYYRRARSLHRAAKAIMQEFGGVMPDSLEDIQRLPGIGRYTAGAIYSFAYDLKAPIVEANTARLYARLAGIEGALSNSTVQKALWATAENLLPACQFRLHNYALMELGALICRPAPLCAQCPLTRDCAAFQTGKTASIPGAVFKPEKLYKRYVSYVIQSGELYLIRKIPEGEWHAGLYEFPSVEERADDGGQMNALMAELARRSGGTDEPVHFADFKYTVTRYSVALKVYRANARKPIRQSKTLKDSGWKWVALDEMLALPIGSAQRKLLDLLNRSDDLFA